MPQYEVTIHCRGASTYIVEADDQEKADDKAIARYANGDQGEQTGAEWDEIRGTKVRLMP
jgi:hypothetical protein